MKSNPYVSRKRFFYSLAKWLGGLVLGLAIGAWCWYEPDADLSVWQQQLADKTAALESERLQSQRLLAQQVLDQAVQQALEERLAQKQSELSRLQEQLAFYEHLLPLADKGAVQVRALDIVPEGDILHYRLLLQRAAGPTLNGRIEFTAAGQQGQDSVTIPLVPIGKETSIPISFEQFLRTAGLLQLPQDFLPSAVTMRIFEGKQLRATHTVSLTESAN